MTILDKIVAAKQREVQQQKQTIPAEELRRRLLHAPSPRDFRSALQVPGQVQIIAEVKKASPSGGVLREDFDPVGIAKTYAANGAAAVSVLTDAPFFQGDLAYLTAIRSEISLPLLRKDFILNAYQVLQARVAGADAVLLIAEILDDHVLADLLRKTRELGMEGLVELYDADNLPRVVDAGAEIIGINNRNLHTFVTRLEHTLDLIDRIPSHCCVVSESGILNRDDIHRLQGAGVDAVLIGETLMRAQDIGSKLLELRGDDAR